MPIREAVPGDLALIARFIRDLAEYERLAHAVEFDEAMLERSLFGDRPYAEVLIAEDDAGEAAGFALFFHNFSTFLGRPGIYLEDLFVRPEARGKGYGKALLGRLAAIAVERGCGRLEWAVLNWNTPSIEFYEAMGARPNSDWTVYRLTGESLRTVGSMAT
jgi:GNAT superfamily N-acetyltransferase